jgi:hypothetical protein
LNANATIGNQAPVHLVIVRVGGSNDRIYGGDGTIEPTYRPDPRAAQLVSTLAHVTRGYAYDTADASGAAGRLRTLFGDGATKAEGVRPTSVAIAPYLVAVALAGLAVILWKRNARSL